MPRKKQTIVENQTAAANALGVDPEVIKRARKLNCPACLPGGRYEVGGLRKWIAENSEALKVEGEKLSLREQKLNEEIRKLRIANDAKEKLVILRSVVAGKSRELGDKCTNLLYAKFVNELPAMLSNDVTSNRVLCASVVSQVVAEINSYAEVWEK